MVIDCPACGAGLMYDPATGKLKCEACESLFSTKELEAELQRRGEKELEREAKLRGEEFRSSEEAPMKDTISLNEAPKHGSSIFEEEVTDTVVPKATLTEAETSDTSNKPFKLKLAEDVTAAAGAASTASGRNIHPVFNPESDFDHPVYEDKDINNPDNIDDDSDETMECSIYTCTSCGAELAINGVEASTFCSFCGQPTVVFNRVASQKKPKYIIPFSVTKERAISLIRERLNRGKYVPDAIKNFEIERVRGIYIPYWLYNIYYHDSQYLKGTVGSGKNSHTYYYFREADCDFTMVTLDASEKLNDETSQRLEPFDTGVMKPFSIEYLSGFYADTYDVNMNKLDRVAIGRAEEMFQKAVEDSIDAHSISVLHKQPDYKIQNRIYAMFPAWFLTFRYENIPYTILVNGQTEKIVGGVPYDRAKVTSSFMVIAIITSIIATFILSYLLSFDSSEGTMKLIITAIIMSFTGLGIGLSNFKKVKESTSLTSLSSTNSFVRDRGKEAGV